MSNFYGPVLVTHIVVAVLVFGSVASVALIAATGRRGDHHPSNALARLGPLLRYSIVSFPIMLITGLLMDFAVNGSFRSTWWFRGSVLLLVATGVLHHQARRVFRSLTAENRADILRRIERIAYGMCALIAAITVLMELKPF